MIRISLGGKKAEAGNITLKVAELNIAGELGIFAETRSEANAGSLSIQPDNNSSLAINFNNEGFISASTTATGDGGSIEISIPQQINIQGQGRITTSTSGLGNAGRINISAQQLNIRDGVEISSSTSGAGDAGSITLNLRESLFISGNESGLFANTEANSTGDGGNININAPLITIENKGAIAVGSFGEGIGGDIDITTNTLNLNNSEITAQTLSTDGGNISLDIQDLLILSHNSNITTTAGTAQAGGDGGDITISAPFIISVPSNPFNKIIANAFEGNGGNINITTNAIFGGEFLIIDASSQLGLDGEVIINDPDVDPTKGLIAITANFIDVESLIAQNPCAIEDDRVAGGSSFTILGKGGLPAQSVDFLRNNIILIPWLEVTPETSEPFKQPEEEENQSIQPSSSQQEEKTGLFPSAYCGNPYVKRRKLNELFHNE